MQDMKYQGPAKLHLQGEGAIYLIDNCNDGSMVYSIGDPDSQMIVRDYRANINDIVRAMIDDNQLDPFYKIFNSPALVTIHSDESDAEIDLQESIRSDEQIPTLWLGVKEGTTLPAYPFSWYLLKTMKENLMAFMMLIV